jgi:glucodextranase-like protein
MRKEIIIAILIGIIFGLVVTYGIYTANKAISQKPGAGKKGSVLPSPTATPEPLVDLHISSPEDSLVLEKSNVTISGTTVPEGIVTIITETDEIITQANAEGVFRQEIELIKGANTITISATDLSKVSQPQVINLVYSTEIEQ